MACWTLRPPNYFRPPTLKMVDGLFVDRKRLHLSNFYTFTPFQLLHLFPSFPSVFPIYFCILLVGFKGFGKGMITTAIAFGTEVKIVMLFVI